MSNTGIPAAFEWLEKERYIRTEELRLTRDGFCFLEKSVADILIACDIDTFPDRQDQLLRTKNFFDDWFLFAVSEGGKTVYGLLKMREQEHDQDRDEPADGDAPGVTVSFIAFDVNVMKACLEDPTAANRKQLGMEINRVVAYPKQSHHPVLKAYFLRPEAEAAYLIGDTYVRRMASFANGGVLYVPQAYRDIWQKKTEARKYARIPEFLERNNREAGYAVCDHQRIYIKDIDCLTEYEKLAVLATHTGNVSFHSFAAEVRYHAMFLSGLTRVSLPLIGSPYASAVRADLSIADKEFQGPAPYYRLDSKLVREQMKYHRNI